MSQSQVGLNNRGNQADYVLGTAEGWDAFGVVRWHGIEELARPYQYEITLQRQVSVGAVDLDTLLDAYATFRVASQNTWRIVHGILAEAEEIDRTTSIILYRVLLVPPFWRARYRRRCRNFLKKSLVDIVSAVLENKSPAHPEGMGGLTRYTSAQAPDAQPDFSSFTAPTATYRWDVKDTSRIEDATVRPYVVQYNESDFDFVARLLEDEGLSFYFEHARDQVTFAITDMPGVSPQFDQSPTVTLRRLSTAGSNQNQEIVRAFRDTRRLRSRAVMVRDWDYLRSAAPLEAKDEESSPDPDLSRHFEFPVGEEAVQADPGKHAATVRKQRYDAERGLREGSSSVRTLAPGYRFTLHDSDNLLQDAKLLTTRVETFATELVPQGTILDEEPFGFANAPGPLVAGHDNRFLALAETLTFRPPMRTPRPRIHGVQAAVVTAEEFATGERPVINGDELGRVRVRFPWDQRADTNDQSPTSSWLRVSQFWAGAGYGALYTPRVGHEVLVAYMQGDPDQPVIVGRVYNAQHTPPYDAKKAPTQSTVKSQSAEEKKEVDGFNEIRFEDKAKKEQIYLHAQRNLDEVVLGSHSTSVGGSQTNTVGYFREHTVHDYETVTVFDDRTTLFKANEHHTVLGTRDTHIGINDDHTIGGHHNVHVGETQNVDVGSDQITNVTGKREVWVSTHQLVYVVTENKTIAGTRNVFYSGTNFESNAAQNHVFNSTNTYFYPKGDFQVDSTTAGFNQSSSFYIKAGSATLEMRSGMILLNNGTGASISLLGPMVIIDGPAQVLAKTDAVMNLHAGAVMNLDGGAVINGTAGAIKLNG